MNEREIEDKGGEEGGTEKHKSAEDLGRELLRAAEDGEVERVRELLQCEGVDVHYYEGRDFVLGVPRTALVVACEGGNAELARLLLEHGGETKQELEGAFWRAARDGHAELVKMLMERGARLYSIHIWVATSLKYSCVLCQKVSQLKNSSEVGLNGSCFSTVSERSRSFCTREHASLLGS
jgi:hypothetical protein